MSDHPGKVLSSLTATSDKRTSKLGGCAGVFFQLFDWNRRLNGKRLLTHRLLPAERPSKKASRNHKDDKLPMAKLLLIADENRGGFPRASHSEVGESFIQQKSPEKKKKHTSKRSPSVVAKLMGLETMPSPEPPKAKSTPVERKSFSEHSSSTIQHSSRTCHNTDPSNGTVISALSHSSSTSENGHVKPPLALICHKSEDPKLSFFCKLPALSPRQAESAFRSILSPSKSHNRLLSPIKSPLATKSAARLLEAAVRILEPSMQPSLHASRNLGTSSRASKSLLRDGSHEDQRSGIRTSKQRKPSMDSKKKHQSILLRPYSDQSKAQEKSKQDKKAGNLPDMNCACKSQAPVNNKRGSSVFSIQETFKSGTTEETVSNLSSSAGQQRLIRSKSTKDENGKSHNDRHFDARVGNEDKLKPELRRQQETCNRLSQRASYGLKKKSVGVKHEVAMCSLDKNSMGRENQDPNRMKMPITEAETLTSLSSDSVITSNVNTGILNYSRVFSSHKEKTNLEPGKTTQNKGDSSVLKSFLRKSVDMVGAEKSVSKSVLKGKKSKRGSIIESHKSSLLDSPIDSLLCRPPSVPLHCLPEERVLESWDRSSRHIASSSFVDSTVSSSFVDFTAENLDMLDEASMVITTRDVVKREASDSHEAVSFVSTSATFVATEVSTVDHSIQSSFQSSTGDVADTALSSYVYPEPANDGGRKRAVSYSGKTTAAILQELLMALNSAKTQLTLEENLHNMSDTHDSVSSSKFSLSTQVGPDTEDSASSVADSRMTQKRYVLGGENTNESEHPSFVSTLKASSEDATDNFEAAKDKMLLSKVELENCHHIVSKRHHIDLPCLGPHSKSCKQASECEEQYVEDIMSTAKLSPVDIYAAKLQMPFASLIDPAVFKDLEEQFYQQWEWGIRPDKSVWYTRRSKTHASFTNSLNVDGGAQNRKLVFDCITEALNLQLGIDEQHSRQSFLEAMHPCVKQVTRSVWRQMEAWRGMACCMNIDDMVDQGMNTGFGKWVDFQDQVSDFAVEMEGDIVGGLIDELVAEMGKKLPIIRRCTRKPRIWAL